MHSVASLAKETNKLHAANEKQKQKCMLSTRQMPHEGSLSVLVVDGWIVQQCQHEVVLVHCVLYAE